MTPIADKLAEMLAEEGLTDILVNTGEFRALGGMPGGGDWPVKLAVLALLVWGVWRARHKERKPM